MELAEEDDGEMETIKLWLRIDDVKKLKGKYKDNEAIEFSFDLNKDVSEDVAQEMVNMCILLDRYIHFIVKIAFSETFIVRLCHRSSLATCAMATTRLSPRLSRTECH